MTDATEIGRKLADAAEEATESMQRLADALKEAKKEGEVPYGETKDRQKSAP